MQEQMQGYKIAISRGKTRKSRIIAEMIKIAGNRGKWQESRFIAGNCKNRGFVHTAINSCLCRVVTFYSLVF